jgi:hypothetical protein
MIDDQPDGNDSLLNMEIPWPKKGDRLFTSDGDSSYLVRTQAGESWESYVHAYRMAAEMLVERTHEPLALNWLIFPILYLYRHYLELRLKSLIWDGDALDGVPPTQLDREHGLIALWHKSRLKIEEWQKDCPKDDLDAVEATILEFDAIDPKSQAARYPKDRAGSPSGILGKNINLDTFAKTVKKTSNFLDSAADVFSEYQQCDGEY